MNDIASLWDRFYERAKIMTGMRDQFESARVNSSGYFSASLNFMTADTRQGLTASAKADFAVIKQYAAENPGRSDVVNYVAKMESSLSTAATTHVNFKPKIRI